MEITKISDSASVVNMKQTYVGREDIEPSSKGYKTTSRRFTYAPASLEQLYKLAFNIEQLPRMRVFEMDWKLLDEKANSEPPHSRIQKSVLAVGYREATAKRRSKP